MEMIDTRWLFLAALVLQFLIVGISSVLGILYKKYRDDGDAVKADKIGKIRDILLGLIQRDYLPELMVKAEKQLGAGTGSLKLEQVMQQLPAVIQTAIATGILNENDVHTKIDGLLDYVHAVVGVAPADEE